MADINEIPTLVSELADLSKRYLEQETIEPVKRLGRFAGMSLGAGALWMLAALFFGLGVYVGLVAVLPEGPWFVVLARFLTVLVTGGIAGIIAWRLTIPIEAPRRRPTGAGS
ncbi:MAG: phage holin family protein [Acidimicrobiia bacterium]|jgi:hypothetical protein